MDGLPSQGFDDATNRITDSGYSYDKAGNVTRGKAPNGSWQNYEYDTAGRLRYVKDDTNWIQQANEYASSRERLSSWSYASVDITYYAWGGSSVIGEYKTQSSSSSLEWQKSYVYAGSRLLSTITNTSGNEVTEYHHPDRLGTRLISNPVTATQSEQNTLPFGTLIGAETSATNDKRFTSYDRSEIAGGLDYAVNRNYNSGQSRFTQVDPIGMAAASIGNPQSLNLYAYVQNNPVDYVDPSGLLMAAAGGVCARGYLTTILYGNNTDGWRIVTQYLQCYDNGGGGGGGGGNRGRQTGLNKGKKASFNLDKFNKCLAKYFQGVSFKMVSDGKTTSLGFSRTNGGNFVGYLNGNVFSISTSVSRNSSTLGRQLKVVGANPTGVDQSGATFGKDPKNNFIASDVASDNRNTGIGLLGLFIHEVGNSLGKISGLADPFKGFANENSKKGIKDPDVGAAFETCVFGGLVGLRSGRVGSRREFF